jgi:D-glucosaminate-6-phosphate ammonia-lyase
MGDLAPSAYGPGYNWNTDLRLKLRAGGYTGSMVLDLGTARSVYEQLGVTPVVNARGNNTVLGGTTPSARVRRAMHEAERSYVDMKQLLERSGVVIADLLGAEAAYVTPGAAAALALGTAACIAGSDPDKIARLPDTTGLPNTVLIQSGHRYHYEHTVTVPGAKLLEVGDGQRTTGAQLEAALGPGVATLLFPAHMDGAPGTLTLSQVIEIAHAKGIPVLVDAAGRVYPLDKFRSYARDGADLVAFGAKYLGALNASGILCGRRDLVNAAAMHGFIGFETVAYGQSFGRPLKVDRQTIVAVVTALQEWLETDHDARIAGYERRLKDMLAELEGAPGVTVKIVHGDGPEPIVLQLSFNGARHDAVSLEKALFNGNPAIAVDRDGEVININPVTLREEDDGLVVSRVGALIL